MLITDPQTLRQYHASHRIWQGIPGIAQTRGGRTFVSFYSGNTKETYGNFAAVITGRDGKNFGELIAVAKKAGKFRCFDPVLWIDPQDRLWFIWNVMPGEEVMGAICDDPDADTLVWSEPFYIGRGIMMNKPTVLSSGEWLFPIAIWRHDIYPEYRAASLTDKDVAGSYVYKTCDNGKSFIPLGHADIRDRSFDEHMVLEQKNGNLMMLVRTNYGIGKAYSYDRGNNWSRGEDSRLGGPCSRFFITRLRSGRVLLINHHNFTKRDHLTALLSEDDGVTFPYALLLDERKNVSYPDAMEGEDGSIYITYDRERGAFKSSLEEVYANAREILTARITEEDILAGSLVSDSSFLGHVASKLGDLAKGDPDPFADIFIDDEDFARQLIDSQANDITSAVFERYPVNCINVCHIDAQKLDRTIDRFRATGGKDIHLLLDIIAQIRHAPTQKKPIPPIIEAVKGYIEEHLTDDFSVAALAEHLHISVYYLAHLFKKVTGTTVLEYRNELRLTKAKLMLIETGCGIEEIASSVGFAGAAYFTECFTASERISPSEYRKYHKKGDTSK